MTTNDGNSESHDGDGEKDAGVTPRFETTRRRGGNSNRNTTVPVSRGEPLSHLSDENRVFLERDFTGTDPVDAMNSVVRMERIRRANPWVHAQLLGYVTKGSRNRIRLIRLLVEQPGGVTLQDIDERLDVTERRRREYVAELRDMGVVERTGRPAVVSFTTDVVQLLAQDVAATYL